jgi:hypothetical protein
MYVSRWDRWARWAPALGILYVILFLAGFLAVGSGPGDTNAEIRSYYTAHPDRGYSLFFLFTAAALALIWFLGTLRAALADAEGPPARLASLAYGAGVANAILLVAAGSTWAAISGAQDSEQFVLDPNTQRVTDSLGYFLFVGSGMAAALLMFATAIVVLRAGIFPRWFGWVSVLTAVIMLFSIIFFPVFVLWAWVLTASALMLMRPARAVTTPTTA